LTSLSQSAAGRGRTLKNGRLKLKIKNHGMIWDVIWYESWVSRGFEELFNLRALFLTWSRWWLTLTNGNPTSAPVVPPTNSKDFSAWSNSESTWRTSQDHWPPGCFDTIPSCVSWENDRICAHPNFHKTLDTHLDVHIFVLVPVFLPPLTWRSATRKAWVYLWQRANRTPAVPSIWPDGRHGSHSQSNEYTPNITKTVYWRPSRREAWWTDSAKPQSSTAESHLFQFFFDAQVQWSRDKPLTKKQSHNFQSHLQGRKAVKRRWRFRSGFSAVLMASRKISMNHSKLYWYMGSTLISHEKVWIAFRVSKSPWNKEVC